MRQQRTFATILTLGLLLLTPVAWACEGRGMQNCSMSECPMAVQQESDDCHKSEDTSDHSSPSCTAAPEAWIAYCDTAGGPEQARIDSMRSRDHGTTRLIILAERMVPRSPSRPLDFISETVLSQQHELGRFTLHSSFLL